MCAEALILLISTKICESILWRTIVSSVDAEKSVPFNHLSCILHVFEDIENSSFMKVIYFLLTKTLLQK